MLTLPVFVVAPVVYEVSVYSADLDIERDLDLDGVRRRLDTFRRYVLFIAFCLVGETCCLLVTRPAFRGLAVDFLAIFLFGGGRRFWILFAS